MKRGFVAAALVLCLTSAAAAQFGGGFGRFGPRGYPMKYANAESFGHGFNFCRAAYTSGRREAGGQGWSTDYPDAELNFSIRLSELTKTRVSKDSNGRPEHVVVRLTEDFLYQCPYLHMEDAMQNWQSQLARVLPPSEYPVQDIPLDHPIFKSMFDVKTLPQIPSIQFWRTSGGSTSERGSDSATPTVQGVIDQHGNVMVLMTHNTDISDAWEREGEDPRFFYQFSPDGYAVGINVILYALTH
jgi:hypothetical protein